MTEIKLNKKRKPNRSQSKSKIQVEFWSMCTLPILYIIIFCYIPMIGIIIAFKDYRFASGIFGSEWCGLQNFKVFLNSADFLNVVWNTVKMNAILIIAGNAAAMCLAILLYNLKSSLSAKIFQTCLISPNFLSWVIASYMVFAFLSPSNGTLNRMLVAMGTESVDWYSTPGAWPYILTIASVWKSFGMESILYYAALMGISPELFEALSIDGGKKWHKIRYIMVPEMVPIICIKLIFAVGGIFGGDFGLFYQVPRDVGALYSTTDIIPTYIFRMMRVNGEMGISTAAGLIQSVVGLCLVLGTNAVVKKIDPERSLF